MTFAKINNLTDINGQEEVRADEDVGHVQGRLDDGHNQELQRIRFTEDNTEGDEYGCSGKPSF